MNMKQHRWVAKIARALNARHPGWVVIPRPKYREVIAFDPSGSTDHWVFSRGVSADSPSQQYQGNTQHIETIVAHYRGDDWPLLDLTPLVYPLLGDLIPCPRIKVHMILSAPYGKNRQ